MARTPWWLVSLHEALDEVVCSLGDALKRELEEAGEHVESSAQELAEGALDNTDYVIEGRLNGHGPETLPPGESSADVGENRGMGHLWNDHVAIALTRRFVNGLPANCERVGNMANAVFSAETPPEVLFYVVQASECYLFGLFQAAAVLARATVERALANRLRRTDNAGLDSLKNEARRCGLLPGEELEAVTRIQQVGNQAAHREPVEEEDARFAVARARRLVVSLYPCIGATEG